jgi:hypothetical protein
MLRNRFQTGDPVIFTKTKFSVHPGPRAEDISPASHGESYSYLVKKFWTVVANTGDRLLVRTRTGKQHWIDLDDPALRAPTWWEQLRYRGRFPAAGESGQMPDEGAGEGHRQAAGQN